MLSVPTDTDRKWNMVTKEITEIIEAKYLLPGTTSEIE